MKETAKRLITIFLKNSIKILSLLLAVTIIAFALISASPVDPVSQYIMSLGTAVSAEQRAELEAYWGVNEPPVERYFNWLTSLLKGDMGHSAIFRRPVADVISERFMNSLALMICAWLFAGIIGFTLGCVMGMFQEKWPDKILKKIGEESTEVIIAGKADDKAETIYEISDLVYHVMVLMVESMEFMHPMKIQS